MALTKPPVLPAWAESGDKVQPSNAEIQTGWPLSNVPPARQRWNWLLNFLANGVRYLTRRGIADWGSDETYEIGDRVQGPDGLTYKALTQNTNKTPASNPSDWTRWGFTASELGTELNKLDAKASCRVATTANLGALSGLLTIDGVTLVAGDRVLVKDQTTGSQNGIYVAAAGAWSRATDADDGTKLTSGATVPVEEGTANADTLWMLTNDGIITIGVSSLVFVSVNGNVGTPGTYTQVTVDAKGRVVAGSSTSTKQLQYISASAAANALTVTLNPTTLDFRSAALTSGAINTRTVSAAISLTVAAGATLGTVNAITSRHAILAIDNAGTVELAIVNLAGGNALDETGVISTTALSGASNSANVIYSTTARSNVPYRVVGFIEGTWGTAGQWTPPAVVQGIGGQALAALSSIGYSQTWQNLTGSRAGGTTYYNTTGRPISVSVTGYSSVNPDHAVLTINGTIVGRSNSQITGNGSGYYLYVTGIVPPGGSYNVAASSGSLTPYLWSELR